MSSPPRASCWASNSLRFPAKSEKATPSTTDLRGVAREVLHDLLDSVEKHPGPANREEMETALVLVRRGFDAKTAARRVVEMLARVLGLGEEAKS